MDDKKYSILFKKLDELRAEEMQCEDTLRTADAILPQVEYDTIDELRRLSEELLDPPAIYSTCT